MLRARYDHVTVLAPSGSTTGGPELLHQLVHEIRANGGRAAIHYVPDASAAVPERYREYDVSSVVSLAPGQADCIIAPETMLRELPIWSPASRYIWWLSYDFFRSRHRGRAGRLAALLYKEALVQILTRSGTRHLFQSHYALTRLRKRGIRGRLLTDYLSVTPVDQDIEPRRNLILFNPKKGVELTNRLRGLNPDLEFQPIIDMTKAEVEAAFRRAKVYIDFGEHPGKDRLPREAAMLGAVVVVGKRGSAAFDEDMPLPPGYKLDLDDQTPVRFRRLIDDIFVNFQKHQIAQSSYRRVIDSEWDAFTQQVREVFFMPDQSLLETDRP